MVLAEIASPEVLLIVLVVVGLVVGSSKLPKLARSLGSAKGEFEKGLKEGERLSKEADTTPDATTKPDTTA